MKLFLALRLALLLLLVTFASALAQAPAAAPQDFNQMGDEIKAKVQNNLGRELKGRKHRKTTAMITALTTTALAATSSAVTSNTSDANAKRWGLGFSVTGAVLGVINSFATTKPDLTQCISDANADIRKWNDADRSTPEKAHAAYTAFENSVGGLCETIGNTTYVLKPAPR
jgi:hypothetical protein